MISTTKQCMDCEKEFKIPIENIGINFVCKSCANARGRADKCKALMQQRPDIPEQEFIRLSLLHERIHEILGMVGK